MMLRRFGAYLVLLVFLIAQRGVAQSYDGRWWLSVDDDTRSGYLEGVADCMTWDAHREGFQGTSQQLSTRINDFYEKHPASRQQLVTDAWQQVWQTQVPNKTSPQNGIAATWSNPHWYLDGSWWGQSTPAMRRGFVHGYLWCSRQFVDSSRNSYPLSDEYYFKKLDEFFDAHPTAGQEPIATSLARFRSSTPSPPR